MMSVPTASVWRRYGHLRIYVSAGDVKLGWCDPRSGRFELHQPAMAEDFWSAVRAECRRLQREGQLADATLPAAATASSDQPVAEQPARPPKPPPVPRPPAQPPHPSAAQPEPAIPAQPGPATDIVPDGAHDVVRDPRWNDLAHNTPGESASAMAKELRGQHPFLVTGAKILGIRTKAGSFAMGAKGEREVGHKLDRWAEQDGWHVIHAVPVGEAGKVVRG